MKVSIPEWRRIRGFVRLCQRQSYESHRADWTYFQEVLMSARRHAEHAATSRIAASKAETEGFNVSAKRYEASAHLDHVAMCARLATAARIVQRMFEYACLDWRPSPDVVGTNLLKDDLDLLCELLGATRAQGEGEGDGAGEREE